MARRLTDEPALIRISGVWRDDSERETSLQQLATAMRDNFGQQYAAGMIDKPHVELVRDDG